MCRVGHASPEDDLSTYILLCVEMLYTRTGVARVQDYADRVFQLWTMWRAGLDRVSILWHRLARVDNIPILTHAFARYIRVLTQFAPAIYGDIQERAAIPWPPVRWPF